MAKRKAKPSLEAELLAVLKRLAESETRITRRNARGSFRSYIAKLKRYVEEHYPVITKEGVPKKKPKAPWCPLCGAVCKTWKNLAVHMVEKHNMEGSVWNDTQYGLTVANMKCFCGKKGSAGGIGRHLASQADLGQHLRRGLATNILSEM
ncbi:MAG: hypothetical protein Unbinned1606contig1000_20 [Prokaryotic dsDNA virus sp.]|nr:MAG: hypothetical protein Unbinned1606contig1000_20 [Prokaryotic dsDNA virus sp.]|tara:strand:- start:533 stop:982 length:450 start_codon:yes stop_codon:yes gene_type:complete